MKIIRVDSCRNCPYIHFEYMSKRWVCNNPKARSEKFPGRITNLNTIPYDCKLEEEYEDHQA